MALLTPEHVSHLHMPRIVSRTPRVLLQPLHVVHDDAIKVRCGQALGQSVGVAVRLAGRVQEAGPKRREQTPIKGLCTGVKTKGL